MRVRRRSIAVSVLVLIFLTVLPLVLQMYIPQEYFRAILTMTGYDLAALLNKIGVLGVAMSAFIILRGSVEKASKAGLGVSIAYKAFWLVVLFFVLGLGNIENLGVAVLGGSGGGASNVVMFDLRLIALLATVIVALMIAHSVMSFAKRNPQR